MTAAKLSRDSGGVWLVEFIGTGPTNEQLVAAHEWALIADAPIRFVINGLQVDPKPAPMPAKPEKPMWGETVDER